MFPSPRSTAPAPCTLGRVPAALALLAVAAAGPAFAQARPKAGAIGGITTAPVGPPARGTTASGADAAPARTAAAPGAHVMHVSGVVFDSLTGAPLAQATVQFVADADRSHAYSAETDSTGRYRITGLAPGRYIAGFIHPDVDALGVELRPMLIDLLPDTAAQVDFGVPGSRTLLPALCGANNPAGRGATTSTDDDLMALLHPKAPGALTGSVRDAETGSPIPGAKVVVTWKEVKSSGGSLVNASRRVPAVVRADGGFTVCGLPADVDLVASAEAKSRRTGLVDVRIASGRLARRDFLLGDSATATVVTLPDTAPAREGRLSMPLTVARGKSRLTGVVRTPDGRPVTGATVLVYGTDAKAQTSSTGTFSLAGLPAGTYSAEVRAIGFAPKRVAVNLTSTRATSVTIPLDQRVQQIEGVVVKADRTKLEKDYTGFLDRVKHGMGHYITEEQLASRQAIQFTDVLRMTPGMNVVPNGSMGYAVQGRGGCTPDIYLDGMPIIDGASSLNDLVNPNDVSGVEIYNGGATTPVQFQTTAGGGSCGTVVVWSKRGRPNSAAGSSSSP
ncbi:MAG TPA: carboxypeptidase regulatory-like domain-containing protein [Gemmatirosa sp.]